MSRAATQYRVDKGVQNVILEWLALRAGSEAIIPRVKIDAVAELWWLMDPGRTVIR